MIKILNKEDKQVYNGIRYDGREETALEIVQSLENGELEYDDDNHFYGIILDGKPLRRGDLFLEIAEGMWMKYDFDSERSHLQILN